MLGIAKGRTDLNFKNTIYRILVTTPIIVFASLFSVNALALAQLPITAIMVCIFWRTVVQGTYQISLTDYFCQFKRVLSVTLFISVIFFVLKEFELIQFESVILKTIVLFALYVTILLISYCTILREDVIFFRNIVVSKKLSNKGNKRNTL